MRCIENEGGRKEERARIPNPALFLLPSLLMCLPPCVILEWRLNSLSLLSDDLQPLGRDRVKRPRLDGEIRSFFFLVPHPSEKLAESERIRRSWRKRSEKCDAEFRCAMFSRSAQSE